jgi:pimeloyl-ACP methyl ester carboxylesterase
MFWRSGVSLLRHLFSLRLAEFLATCESLFKTPEAEMAYCAAYEESLRLWPAAHESLEIPTKFGLTHVIACGSMSGAPILLLPAMSLSATMWYATVSGLCGRFRCYAADFPSDIGLSAVTNPPTSRKDCTAWLNELFDGLGIATPSLIGSSYGSFLAMNYAIAEPARVKRLVLTSPAAGFVGLWSFYPRMFLSLLLPGRSFVERILNWVFEDRLSFEDPVVKQLMVGAKGLQPRLKIYPKVFSDSQLAGITAPVYLLLGEKEVCYNPRSAARRARRLMPHALVEVLPDAGHLMVLECPSTVNQRILAFLRD